MEIATLGPWGVDRQQESRLMAPPVIRRTHESLPELISDLGFQISDLQTQLRDLCKSGFHGRKRWTIFC